MASSAAQALVDNAQPPKRKRGRPPGPSKKPKPVQLKVTAWERHLYSEADLRRACQSLTVDVLAVVENILQTAPEPRVRLQAAQIILDRAYGKPVEAIDPANTAKLIGKGTPDSEAIEYFQGVLAKHGLEIVPKQDQLSVGSELHTGVAPTGTLGSPPEGVGIDSYTSTPIHSEQNSTHHTSEKTIDNNESKTV